MPVNLITVEAAEQFIQIIQEKFLHK